MTHDMKSYQEIKRRYAALIELEHIEGARVLQRFPVPFTTPRTTQDQLIIAHDNAPYDGIEAIAYDCFAERLRAGLEEYRRRLEAILTQPDRTA